MSLDCVIHVQRYWVMPVKMIQNDPPRPGTLVVDFKVEILRPVLFRLSSGIDICTLALCGRQLNGTASSAADEWCTDVRIILVWASKL